VAPEQGLAIPLPAPRAGVVPLDELTSRPRLVLAGEPPRYNEQARVTRAEGTAVARCTVSPQGTLEQCKLLKAVPLMEDAILASLRTRRYEPGRVGTEAVASEINVVMKIQAR
jgi:protein TonB